MSKVPFYSQHGISVFAAFYPHGSVALYWDDACDRHIGSFLSELEARLYAEDLIEALHTAAQHHPADAA